MSVFVYSHNDLWDFSNSRHGPKKSAHFFLCYFWCSKQIALGSCGAVHLAPTWPCGCKDTKIKEPLSWEKLQVHWEWEKINRWKQYIIMSHKPRYEPSERSPAHTGDLGNIFWRSAGIGRDRLIIKCGKWTLTKRVERGRMLLKDKEHVHTLQHIDHVS